MEPYLPSPLCLHGVHGVSFTLKPFFFLNLVIEVFSLVVCFVAYVQTFQPRYLLFRDAAWFFFRRFKRKLGQYLEASSHLFRWHVKVPVWHYFFTLLTAFLTNMCVIIHFLRSNHKLFVCWTFNRWQVVCSFIQMLISTLFLAGFHFVATNGDCAFGDICLYRSAEGSIPDGVIGIFHWHNPSDRTMALG